MTHIKHQHNGDLSGTASIVGPDCIQVLRGDLFDKKVALILCGESHEDAIDVTRRGGRFEPNCSWIERTKEQVLSVHNNDQDDEESCLKVRVFATCKKILPVGKSHDWAKQTLEQLDLLGQVVLVWVQDKNAEANGRVSKGKAYILGLATEDSLDEEDEDYKHWIDPTEKDTILPLAVREWFRLKQDNTFIKSHYRSFEWGDLDMEAFELNRRRLTDEEIDTKELDAIVERRKERLRRKDSLWTWDDWFAHVRTEANHDDMGVELILEASIPPWELSIHRPAADEDPNSIHLPPAADCIRSMPEDEEGDEEDDYDPSSDGVGSYLDFIYRRFMEEGLGESNTKKDQLLEEEEQHKRNHPWLHCVDMRDLGCQAACHSESVKKLWNNLLTVEEQEALKPDQAGKKLDLGLSLDSTGQHYNFVPESRMNPERLALKQMKLNGTMTELESDDDEEEDDEEFTFPSFEGFFGQNTDFLYYSPPVKLAYSPFLAQCVRSYSNWQSFFTHLFLGGTIPDAMAFLDLNEHKDHLYVRSPIRKARDAKTSKPVCVERDDGEHFITYPYFPFIFYLHARATSPPRTWSSSLYARLCSLGEEQKQVADAAKDWTLEIIKKRSENPKQADDPECGGEWFEAFLYAVHRDIYDDIDRSDTTQLLKKNKMKGLTSGRKYNIGRISIPSCHDGFDEIVEQFRDGLAGRAPTVTPRVEVMAKILIDIWMSSLVDFSTVLKVAEIVASPENNKKSEVVVVCYMGTAHTRAVANFFVDHMRFKKKGFYGKTDYDEYESRALKLQKSLWKLAELFR